MKIISLYDKVAQRFVSVTLCENEQAFIRTALPAILMDYNIIDVSCYVVGDFDSDLGIVKPCLPRLVDWNCYRFPEKRDSLEKRYLTVEDIDSMAKAKKHEFLQKQKDKIEDIEHELSKTKAKLQLEEQKDKKDKKRIKELRDYINVLSKNKSILGAQNE